MLSTSWTIVLLALLITYAAAMPASLPAAQPKGRSFKVDRVKNKAFTGHDGPKQLLKAYKKFGMPIPSELAAAVEKRDIERAEKRALAARWVVVEPVTSDKHKGEANAAGAGGLAGALAGLLGGAGAGAGAGAAGAGAGAAPAAAAPAASSASKVTASVKATASAKASSVAASVKPTATAAAGNSTGGTGTGKVTATPEEPNDIEYISPISIGGQTINMDFDSGSSDLWVFSTQLPAASTTGHTLYDSSKSTTFKALAGATFSISYGDGSGAAGNVGTDTVNIGGATVTSQAVELATAVSASFTSDTASNGLVGLAFSKLNTVKPTQQKTFFDNVIPSLAEPVFTADLKADAVGAYEFGRIDATKFNGSLSWAAVNTTNGFWQFSTSKFAVGGVETTTATSQAIADTGTTLMLVSSAIANGYYSKVTGAVNNATVGGVTFPCNTVLPDLAVDVGGNYMAVIPGKFINFAKVDASGTTCFGGVQPTTSSLQIWGDIMFKAQFVVFNGGNASIAMAPHN